MLPGLSLKKWGVGGQRFFGGVDHRGIVQFSNHHQGTDPSSSLPHTGFVSGDPLPSTPVTAKKGAMPAAGSTELVQVVVAGHDQTTQDPVLGSIPTFSTK
jgi:hypothetical protein